MSRPTFLLRAAREEDHAAIAALAGELGYPSTPEAVAGRWRALAADPHAAALVAERDGLVVGWMHVGVAHTLDSDPFAEIVGLVVADRARGQGVGAALVDAAKAWARDRGLGRLRVRSNVVRERAHRFYEHQGFALKKTQRVFDLDLTAG
jgi:GNAT superfamily N-acetyltransferase